MIVGSSTLRTGTGQEKNVVQLFFAGHYCGGTSAGSWYAIRRGVLTFHTRMATHAHQDVGFPDVGSPPVVRYLLPVLFFPFSSDISDAALEEEGLPLFIVLLLGVEFTHCTRFGTILKKKRKRGT